MGTRAFALVAILASAAGVSAWAATREAQLANTSMSIDEVLNAYRNDLQGNRADILRKNLTLTREQADRFWPLFEQYQKEQSAIMDEQMRGIQTYISSADKMDDAAALTLMQTHLDRDTRMAELRRRWLSDFQAILPTKLAVRAMQIDRRISLAQQTQFSEQIPLVK